METRAIPTQGIFSLRELTLFGFGYSRAATYDDVMRLAFTVDGGYRQAAGVAVRQVEPETLELTIDSPADPDVVASQTARILSCNVDARGFTELGERDAVIGALQAVAPGLRPPQFTNPYEAAAWGIISGRRSAAQGVKIRQWLNERYGTRFDVAGEAMGLPAPDVLASVGEIPSLPSQRVEWLRGIGRAASAGLLEPARLLAMDPEEAKLDLQRLPGIGPFYSALIVLRALGLPDVMSLEESQSRAAAMRLYQLEPMSDQAYLEFARRWAPWRTWAIVLIRAANGRLA